MRQQRGDRARRFRVPRARHALALPSLGWTAAFFVAPLALLAVYSLGQIDIITFQVSWGWTLDSYRRINDPLYLDPILRSLVLSLGATLGCLVVGFPVALWISRLSGRQQTLALVAVMIPFWSSFVVRTYALVNLLEDGGPLARVLHFFHLSTLSPNILYTPTAIAIGIIYSYLPLMVLPLFVALERIDPALLAAAADLGAPRRRAFRRVVLPLAAPGVIAGCILVGIPATGEYVIPAILGGDKTLMLGNVIADQFLKVGDYPFGSALAMTLTTILTALLLFGRGRLRRYEEIA
jgi:ABC-type spermidine/putrescine transport system permease subunit I